MSPITTHVLDTSRGRPAEGVAVSLSLLSAAGEPIPKGAGVTDADGRVADLLEPEGGEAGRYRLTFDTAAYFARISQPYFYPRVEIVFEITDPGEHYHVPLLLAPHGYTTYRGS